ncbi:hypothetical protein NC652_025065 [Populus alba x Populus x berolinensis]|nr:hypothetical protein NC652_025065 [Populus alba x Populus x berolinensis]
MILSLPPKINVDTIRIDEPRASVGGQSVNSSPHAKRDKNRFIPRLRIRVARHSFITPTRSLKSGPEGTASLFLLSSPFLSSQNMVCGPGVAAWLSVLSFLLQPPTDLALTALLLQYTSRTTVVRHVTFISSRLVGGPHCLFIDKTGHAADCSMPITKNMFVFMLIYCNKLMLCGIHHPLKLQVLELGALLFHIADMKCFSVAVKPDDVTCGSPTWIGKGLTCEERLERLKNRMKVYFDASRPDHQPSFQHLLRKQGGKRSAWEYPFAVAGVNITFMIMQMLDLDAKSEWAFDLLYCVAFVVMDNQWLHTKATYMEFNDVLKSTRAQVERELLMDDVLRIEDMPSYSLLI